MADMPILFSGPMVRALLAGTKTQTRRALKNCSVIAREPQWGARKDARGVWCLEADTPELSGHITPDIPIAVGDRLYVRETWTHTGTGVWTIADTWHARDGAVAYQADEAIPGGKYWPSIHMPKRYSRLTLTVTDVRVERLRDIIDDDSFAEGISTDSPVAGTEIDIDGFWWPGAGRARYRKVWESINGPDSWEANPWVAAYSFTVERANIDLLAKAT